ncbi:hypothetical protein CgunFtcFv8_009135 [Champsocephalus gunnari]|uniref:Uncharacterized protein n=1 Tax=Champsocephalus gunnari TaxID=52237 RepID=A0AAN8HFU8_CHAGU|nr:hypothetical protein CgunFtcFv8_009135 [Champsocephalus gunnari]
MVHENIDPQSDQRETQHEHEGLRYYRETHTHHLLMEDDTKRPSCFSKRLSPDTRSISLLNSVSSSEEPDPGRCTFPLSADADLVSIGH